MREFNGKIEKGMKNEEKKGGVKGNRRKIDIMRKKIVSRAVNLTERC